MPNHLAARVPADALEERQVRKLAHSVHAPADWILHAKIVSRSWDGRRARQIAEALGGHPATVRERLHAFNDRGLDGLGVQPGAGRKPRLTEGERSTILALVHLPPPGKPTDELTGELAAPDPEAAPEWTLDTLTAAARASGLQVARSHVRRIFRTEGLRWRRTRLSRHQQRPRLRPNSAAIVARSTTPPEEATVRLASTNSAPSPHAPSPQHRAGPWMATASRGR
jgi:transposase